MKIKTEYWAKPIPYREFDWSAVDDDTYDGPGSPIGFGRTEDEAIRNLLEEIGLFDWIPEPFAFSDEKYADAAEAEQRRRDAKEGFDET